LSLWDVFVRSFAPLPIKVDINVRVTFFNVADESLTMNSDEADWTGLVLGIRVLDTGTYCLVIVPLVSEPFALDTEEAFVDVRLKIPKHDPLAFWTLTFLLK
jgi:hypothetical protein